MQLSWFQRPPSWVGWSRSGEESEMSSSPLQGLSERQGEHSQTELVSCDLGFSSTSFKLLKHLLRSSVDSNS